MVFFVGVLIILAATFFTGLALVVNASKGTRAVQTCSCGYDLRRLPRASPCCPECGARRGHVTIRNQRRLTIGLVVMMLPFVLAMIVVGYATWRLR